VLQAPIELLGDLSTVIRMVECCQGLHNITITSPAAYGWQSAPASAVKYYQGWGSDRHSWHPLSELSALTSLRLGLSNAVLGQEEWSCLALLTSLCDLSLWQLNWGSISGMTALLACRKLTKFEVMVGWEHLVLTSKVSGQLHPAAAAAVQVLDNERLELMEWFGMCTKLSMLTAMLSASPCRLECTADA
jgi:hypothetical protein